MNTASDKVIASDFNPQMFQDSHGNWRRASMEHHRKFRYDPFAPGEEYAQNPWLLEDQIGALTSAVEKETISPELIERRVSHLDIAISALATNPFFNTNYITQFLWVLALRLHMRGHLKQAEIIVDRARFVDKVMCRNPIFNGDLMIAAGIVKMSVGKYVEASEIFSAGLRNDEKEFRNECDVSSWLAELAACYMAMERYDDAAECYTRSEKLSPTNSECTDERFVRHRQNQAKLVQLGFPPNPQRRRSWSETRYLRGRKKIHKEYAAKCARMA